MIKYHSKADLTIQQWLKLVEIKCKQIQMDMDDIGDHLIDILEGDALIFYLDFLTKEKNWKKIKERLVLQYSAKKEDVLTDFLNLRLYEYDNLEEFFRTKLNLGTKLGFTEKQIVNSMSQAVEIMDLQKLLIANDVETLQTWKEKASALITILQKEERLKRKSIPSRQPLQTERPQFNSRRVPEKPSTPCSICENRGHYGLYHWQNQCRLRGRPEGDHAAFGRPSPSSLRSPHQPAQRDYNKRYVSSSLHNTSNEPTHTTSHK